MFTLLVESLLLRELRPERDRIKHRIDELSRSRQSVQITIRRR